jgi:hypothetical protein
MFLSDHGRSKITTKADFVPVPFWQEQDISELAGHRDKICLTGKNVFPVLGALLFFRFPGVYYVKTVAPLNGYVI